MTRPKKPRLLAWLLYGLPILALGGMLLATSSRSRSPRRPQTETAELHLESDSPSFEQDGLRVSMDAVALRHGQEAKNIYAYDTVQLSFSVTEGGDPQKPVRGLRPLSWLIRRKEGEPLPDRDECKKQIRSLLAGRLRRNAEVNLNEYYLVTLDDHNSLSIIDPQVESSKTKTVGMINLQCWGEDFVLTPDRKTVLVTLPKVGKVGASDLRSRRTRYDSLGGTPSEIELQPDGRFAWIALEDTDSIVAYDTSKLEIAESIPVMQGPHTFAFDADSRFTFVTSPTRNELAVVDTHRLAPIVSLPLEGSPIDLTYSPKSRQVYVLLNDGAVSVIDGDHHQLRTQVNLGEGTTQISVTPDGRFLLAVNPAENHLTLLDTSTNRPAFTVETEEDPYRVDYTDSFAYLHHRKSPIVILVDLYPLGNERKVVTSSVVMGQSAPNPEGTPAPPIMASLPEGGGGMFVNREERTIYHYMEGMSAPMGSYETYPWPARGILLVDKTIQEEERGVYRTDFRAPAPGSYTVPFLVSGSPQLYGCFNLEIEGLLTTKSPLWKEIKLEPLFRAETLEAETPTELRVRLTDPESGSPISNLKDVVILISKGPLWNWRAAATPGDDGTYSVKLNFPEAGSYSVLVAAKSRGLRFGALPMTYANVIESGIHSD